MKKVTQKVSEIYKKALLARGYEPDFSQKKAVESLQRVLSTCLYSDWIPPSLCRSLRRIFRVPNPMGVWLYGGVGAGKTFLMDCFVVAIEEVQGPCRWHFHEWMQEVHCQLRRFQGQRDPLVRVAQHLAKGHSVLCLDEFHVTDIADAMILGGLLQAFLASGTTFVATSNSRPDELYPDGLHRDRFEPTIKLLDNHMELCHVGTGVDYRVKAKEDLGALQTYFSPISEHTERELERCFNKLYEHDLGCLRPSLPPVIVQTPDVFLMPDGRGIETKRRQGRVVWFEFIALCEKSFGPGDYLAVAQNFDAVIVSGVPQMGSSAARRFVWLIDILYDRCVRLVLSARCAPHELYPSGGMGAEFSRTVSRLQEMQSEAYGRRCSRRAEAFQP